MVISMKLWRVQYTNDRTSLNNRWMDGWVGGWVGGWMDWWIWYTPDNNIHILLQ